MTLIAFRDPVSAWTHCAWLVLAIPATCLLWRRCRGDRSRQVSMLIYGLGLAACYAGSTLFHGAHGDEAELELYDRIDHIGIYLLIAGTYTPMAWNMMRDNWRVGVLASVWGSAFFGSSLLVFLGVLSPFWSTLIYLIMGWGGVFCYVELLRVVSHRTLFPLLFGGILYTVGALINLDRSLVVIPGVFGAHEIFHLFVMAGTLSHYLFISNVVARYPRPTTRPVAIPIRTQRPARPAFAMRWIKVG